MPRFEQIRDRIPTLYRPEKDDRGLLTRVLKAVGLALEEIDEQSSDVLRAHWVDYADRALYDRFFTCCRQVQELVQPRPGDLIDLRDPAGFAAKLKASTDPISKYLRDNLSEETAKLLREFDASGDPSEALKRSLIDDLNARLKDNLLYDEQRFAHVSLTQEAKQLSASQPVGNELIHLNQLLLEQAYPAEMAKMLLDLPYIHDLARLSSLLPLAPWLEPPTLRDSVEKHRLRVKRVVALYRNGLGTVNALRSMVEAQLPRGTSEEIPERRDMPFVLEEFAPVLKRSVLVPTRGKPAETVGPLMRWTLTNGGVRSTSPTIYIQGVTPQEDLVDATQRPVVELYSAGEVYPRLGIAYQGDIDPGQTLRLRPAFSSWLGLSDGVRRAQAEPTESCPADRTAPEKWYALKTAPSGSVEAVCQSHDRRLWVAANAGGVGTLWWYGRDGWTAAPVRLPSPLGQLPPINCIAEDNQSLLVGTEKGLLRIQLYPEQQLGPHPGESLAADWVWEGGIIHCVLRDRHGVWWIGTGSGLVQAAADGTITPPILEETVVYAITQDAAGALNFGTQLGLFQYLPEIGSWYWYAGREHREQADDWKQFFPDKKGRDRKLPGETDVFLPPVWAVHRGPDASLWIGTEKGIARYVAHSVSGLTYSTLLEAYPDLCTDKVFDIREDECGVVWFCTARGLFKYDGRDFWQVFMVKECQQLGRADTLYDGAPEARGAWRFNRSLSEWQRYDEKSGQWRKSESALRSAAGPEVHTVAWSDHLVADLGEWDGASFTKTADVDVSKKLVVRYKPTEELIVDGGIPAAPRLPPGSSVWRYLSLETEDMPESPNRPWWSREGRLFPPEDQMAPYSGRYGVTFPTLSAKWFSEVAYAYKPAAKVWFEWNEGPRLTVLLRLQKRFREEQMDPAVVDRVWQGIQQVRPAGVRVMLAVEHEIVRGG